MHEQACATIFVCNFDGHIVPQFQLCLSDRGTSTRLRLYVRYLCNWLYKNFTIT